MPEPTRPGGPTPKTVSARPRDTSREAWAEQLEAFRRMGPEGRVRAALELSEEIRTIQIEGILARNPDWTRADAVRHLVVILHGIDLPTRPPVGR
jgi:hypothetical protein